MTGSMPSGPGESRFCNGTYRIWELRGVTRSTLPPQLHLEYLSEQLAVGQPALGFVFVRHILVAGPVDISGLPLDRL